MDQRSCQSLTLSPNKINNSVTFSKADSRLLKQYRRRHLSLVDKLSSPSIFWTTGGSSDQQLSLSTDFTISNACRRILSLVIMKPETGDNSALSSNADFSSSSSVGKSPSTLTADSNSTFRTLNRKKLTAAVRAVKGKFRNSHYYPKRKIELIRPTQIKSDNTEENRISVCLKELEVSQLYLNDVIKKEKLVMLPGSASIVLDIVLKLLLMLNEKRLQTKTTQSLPAKQNASVLAKYNDVYHCLAMLLQHTDKLVVNGKVDATNDRTKVTSLNKNLLDAIQILINAVDETQSKQLIDRSHSLESRVSSSDSSDLGNEDADFDLLRELDQVNNNSSSGNCSISVPGVCPKFDGVSNESIVVGYDPNKPPPKPPHPNLLLLQKQFGHDTGSVESAVSGTASSGSPPSADSGVESLAAADERCHNENSLLSLDELFARLHLTNSNNQQCGGGVDNWSTWSDLSTATSDGNLTLPNLNILRNCHHFEQQQEQHVNNEQQSDQQTTSEEKEELCGDTMIKTKKITTKQVMKKTIVKTSHALVQGVSGDLQTVDDYGDLIKRLTGANNGEGELKFVETETYKLNGASQQSIDAGGKFPLATTSEVGNEKAMVNKRLVNVANLNWPKVRPVSEYENSRSSPTVSFGRHAGNGQSTVKVHQNMVQQSTSVQSISRQAMINGKLVADDSAEKSDTSLLKASKSDTFHNGALTDRTGSGSIVEEHREVRCQKTKPSQSTDEPDDDFSKPNAKPNTVSSYIKIFGSYQPGNPSNFHAELASYQNIRDKWQSHEETNKKKAFTFQFSNNSNNNNFGSAKGQTRAESDKQPWMNLDKSATAPQTLSTKLGRSDFQNLMDFFELNDRLKFPHRPAVECGPVQKSVTFPKSLAISFVNYLDEEDVSRYLYCKKETEEGPEIRGAPIDVLIVYATQNIANQRGCFYQEAFLITYRTFVSPVDLIKKLIYRYEKFSNESSDKDVQKRKIAKNTFSLLVCVVDDLSSADLTDHVLTTLNNFLFRMVYAGELNLSRYLRQRLTNRYQAKQDFFADLYRVLYSPYSPGSLRNITVLDFKSNLLAEQFTYLDWFHFKKIELSELLLWAQQQTEEHSPNLTSFTAHFNNMSYWMRTRILQSADAKEREAVFSKFLKVMHHLKRLGNFNSLFAMLSALDSGSIRRLDWPKGSTEQLAEYTVLTDSSQSFKSYRSALADTKPPCLPYIGIILQDLTFVHIGNPNLLPENHCEGRVDVVNFAKRWQQYTIMDNMRRFKAWPYNLKKNEQVLAYLNDFADHLSEDELWERSEKLKPKPRNGPTLKRTV